MANIRFVVSLPEEWKIVLDALAAAEQRSRSNMGEVLLTEALQRRHGVTTPEETESEPIVMDRPVTTDRDGTTE